MSRQAEIYEDIAIRVPDSRFLFMNHGYAALDRNEDFADLRAEDALWRYQINLVRTLVRGVGLDGKDLLDVGSGRGGACSYLARYHRPKSVTGLEYNAKHVELCNRAFGDTGARFQRGDAQKLPFRGHHFDVVLNMESSHLYPDRPKFFREVRRVLRPGGVFGYTDVFSGGLGTVEQELAKAGFVAERSEDITANVARAIYLNRSHFEVFLQSMIDPKLGNEGLLRDLCFQINERMFHYYMNRRNTYHAWVLRPA
jgi:ubiquinone/menaquinone biosynthesis C-methylase UbiE